MINKYYLLENVKEPETLIKEYATYRGGKSQLESQLAEKPALFDSGNFRLIDQNEDKRKKAKYLHLLVEGTESDFESFESFLDSADATVAGGRTTYDSTLDNLVSTYLPGKKSGVLKNAVKTVFGNKKNVFDLRPQLALTDGNQNVEEYAQCNMSIFDGRQLRSLVSYIDDTVEYTSQGSGYAGSLKSIRIKGSPNAVERVRKFAKKQNNVIRFALGQRIGEIEYIKRMKEDE